MAVSRARVGLWTRMAAASVLALLLLGIVVGAALLLVGLPVYGLVWYAVDVLEAGVSAPLATVVAVAGAAVGLLTVECALRAIRTARERDDGINAGPFAEGVVTLASYTLLLSSIVVALFAAPLVADVLPTAVFALLVVLAFFYLITISYVWSARMWVRQQSDDYRERSSAGNAIVMGVFGVGYLTFAASELFASVLVIALVAVGLAALVAPARLDAARDRLAAYVGEDDDVGGPYHGLTDETRRLLAGLERAPGPRPAVLAVVAVPLALAAVYAAATVWPTATIALALAAGCALAFVGGHVVGAVRGEFGGDIAVLRDIEDRTGLERLGDLTAEDPALADLEETVTRLAGQADLPVPDVRLAESDHPEALTVGYRPASSTIVLSRGLVDALAERELEAVLAHEIAHVANRDAAVLTALAAPGAIARRTTGRYGFNPVIEPLAMLTAGVSRWYVAFVARAREYAADDGAVAITGDPAGLASALESLDDDLERRPSSDLREQGMTTAFSIVPPPWEEHRFFDRTRRLIARGIFGTHPATERRIDRLRTRV